MGDKIVYTEDNIWIYDDNSGLWSNSENDLNIEILKHEKSLQFAVESKNSSTIYNYRNEKSQN